MISSTNLEEPEIGSIVLNCSPVKDRNSETRVNGILHDVIHRNHNVVVPMNEIKVESANDDDVNLSFSKTYNMEMSESISCDVDGKYKVPVVEKLDLHPTGILACIPEKEREGHRHVHHGTHHHGRHHIAPVKQEVVVITEEIKDKIKVHNEKHGKRKIIEEFPLLVQPLKPNAREEYLRKEAEKALAHGLVVANLGGAHNNTHGMKNYDEEALRKKLELESIEMEKEKERVREAERKAQEDLIAEQKAELMRREQASTVADKYVPVHHVHRRGHGRCWVL